MLAIQTPRGRPKSESTKQLGSVHYAPEVLESSHRQAYQEFVQEIGRLKGQNATEPVSKRLEAAKVQVDLEMSAAVGALIDAVLGMYVSSRTFHLMKEMKEIVDRKEVERRPVSVQQLEWEHIHRVLLEHDGNISAAARALNMHRRTLQRKLRKPTPWWSRAPGTSPHGHPIP